SMARRSRSSNASTSSGLTCVLCNTHARWRVEPVRAERSLLHYGNSCPAVLFATRDDAALADRRLHCRCAGRHSVPPKCARRVARIAAEPQRALFVFAYGAIGHPAAMVA